MIGGILVLFIYITRLASNEIFSPSNKIHREVGRAKDLSAPLYTDRVKPKYLEENVSQCQGSHFKSYNNCPKIELLLIKYVSHPVVIISK